MELECQIVSDLVGIIFHGIRATSAASGKWPVQRFHIQLQPFSVFYHTGPFHCNLFGGIHITRSLDLEEKKRKISDDLVNRQ